MTRAARSALGLAAVLATASFAAPAIAEESNGSTPDMKARAQVMFEQAKALMKENDFTAACPKFAESERLDPAVGTLLNLANCFEKAGRTASAWVTYKEAATAARRAGQADREQLAKERAASVEGALSTLTIKVPASSAVDGLAVKLDGGSIGSAEWGTGLPLDPGKHTVDVSAPGKKTVNLPVNVAAGHVNTDVSIPLLEQEAPAVASVVAPVLPQPSAPSSAPEPSHGSPQRTIGLLLGGAGIVGLGLGTVFGLQAKSKNDDAKALCPNSPQCNEERGVTLTHQAQNAAIASTVAFVAGGVLLAGGAVLFFTAPHPDAASPSASQARLRATDVRVAPAFGGGLWGVNVGGGF